MKDREAEAFGKTMWKPKTGRQMQFSTMNIGWLENVVRFLEWRHQELHQEEMAGWFVLSGLQGEMAIDTAESQLKGLSEQSAELDWFIADLREYVRWRKAREPNMSTLGALLQDRGLVA